MPPESERQRLERLLKASEVQAEREAELHAAIHALPAALARIASADVRRLGLLSASEHAALERPLDRLAAAAAALAMAIPPARDPMHPDCERLGAHLLALCQWAQAAAERFGVALNHLRGPRWRLHAQRDARAAADPNSTAWPWPEHRRIIAEMGRTAAAIRSEVKDTANRVLCDHAKHMPRLHRAGRSDDASRLAFDTRHAIAELRCLTGE